MQFDTNIEGHARKNAFEHIISGNKRPKDWSLPKMNENYAIITDVYKSLNEDVQKKLSIPPAAEWLLDNFYIIEEQVKSLRRDLIKKEHLKLPALKLGTYKGFSRVSVMAFEIVSYTEGQIDEKVILSYITSYQSNSLLLDREIWALCSMLKLALVDTMRYICEKIRDTRNEWRKADDLLSDALDDEDHEKSVKSIDNKMRGLLELNPSFIEHLSYRLRRAGREVSHAVTLLDEYLSKNGVTLEEITKNEHNAQAESSVFIGNCITSIKFLSTIGWNDIFEQTSRVVEILNADPDGTYPEMDLKSRNDYRKRIEEISALTKHSELHIANEAVELATHSNISQNQSEERQRHVGYYFYGNGLNLLKEQLSYKPGFIRKVKEYFKNRPAQLYFGSIILMTILLTTLVARLTYSNSVSYRLLYSFIAFIAAVIPMSEITISLVNFLVCNSLKPATLPRLEFKGEIPQEYSTMVVIPALLPDAKRAKEVLQNLETHYHANKQNNIFFALAGDFKDAPSEYMPEDEAISSTAISIIKSLNEKYAEEGKDRFFFFHRHRQFNDAQNKWMGWERKRGALLEFNDLLSGSADTSYSISSAALAKLPQVKYVITLDADTILPISEAKKMIGTIAHPLNRAIVSDDGRLVVEGYGLIQPRIIFDMESSGKSLFSRIFTGQEGLDPYASAISDVYQDLFGEGIFTGKGIYELKVFHNILKNAIPENAILSHDLLEGSYVRAGLATDLELVDSYPSRYNSYAARLHRWIRGDWQLLPWLGAFVKNSKGVLEKNPLSFVSKWKIGDNLRRSLLYPSLYMLILLGFNVLPGKYYYWLGLALLTLSFPLILSVTHNLLYRPFVFYKVKRHAPIISGLKASFYQTLLMFILLPYQAWLIAGAIFITLSRLVLTKRNLLEWVTAADVEKGQKNSLASYVRKMKIIILLVAIIFVPAIFYNYESLFFAGMALILIWLASPYIAYKVSQISEEMQVRLPEEDLQELRLLSRKTWRYFEEFQNACNHYLAPDNYQEYPPNGVASRTSPTNIGLGLLAVLTARDMGYIGTQEMLNIISGTITTVERLEKWNGHLYNWYDTCSLHPLRPRYISTVDSGNFICYLITLLKGMEEYLNKPLIDTNFTNGLNDTLSLVPGDVKFPIPASDDLLTWDMQLEELSVYLTKVLISQKEAKKRPWEYKLAQMVRLFKKELYEFMPWVEMLKSIPDSLKNNEKFLELPSSMYKVVIKDMPGKYNNLLPDLESLKETLSNDNEDLKVWLDEFICLMNKSIDNTNKFIAKYNSIIERITSISQATTFKPLFIKKKQLFSIGYNIEENKLTNSCYDLLASEARQASYLAIAKGEVPPEHWFKLSRTLTVVDHYKGLVSWTGTMFEYLMPLLITKSYRNTLLDETYDFVIKSQVKYGKQRQVPWGFSESGFYSLDINMDYQYKAIGIPWLGLKRGLVEDLVVSPYSTVLALTVFPELAMENIKILKKEGLDGPYGLYEAADYTSERIPVGSKNAIVKSFMAHHQGMSLLALNNYLNNNIMQKRFHADPVIKATELILQERIPSNLVFTKESKEKVTPFKDVVYKDKGITRKFNRPDPVLPKTHILSNGTYSVMLTDRGTGYSRSRNLDVTRWREDVSLNTYGMFFYLRNVDTNNVWSATYSPLNIKPEKYEVIFSSDKARFRRKDGDIETSTDIIVASGDNSEIRRISLKNRGEKTSIIEISSFFEIALSSHAADVAHPAFSNLFVSTEIIDSFNCIVANRRPRSSNDQSLWISNSVVIEGERSGSVHYETDRMQFIGHGHNASSPVAIERNKPLTGSSGAVLDPAMSIRVRVKVEPGRTVRISYITSVNDSREGLIELVEKYSLLENIESAFRLALTRSQVEARYLNIKAREAEVYQDMISHILYISPLRQLKDYIIENKKGQSALWPYGISGDLPIVLVSIRKADETDIVYEVLKAHEYWKIKGLRVDIIILNDEEGGYTNPLRAYLSEIVKSSHAHEYINKPGGVFILNKNNLEQEDVILLHASARLVFKGDAGTLAQQMKASTVREALPGHRTSEMQQKTYNNPPMMPLDLNFFNGIGGFSKSGKEYIIKLDRGHNTPVPWINVIANKDFGFIVSELGMGYTWYKNSRENKLTPWSNDVVGDNNGEMFYITDNTSGDTWSLTPHPIREEAAYIAKHGFGYSIFEHINHGLEHTLTQFVPTNEPVKISMIELKNHSDEPRNISLTYYIRPVLGVNEQTTAMHISTEQEPSGMLVIKNNYNEEFPDKLAFVDVSESQRFVTGDRKEFFGKGQLNNPEGLKQINLSNVTGHGYDPCAAMQVFITIKPNEEKKIVYTLGMADSLDEINTLAQKYRNVEEAGKALSALKVFWEEKLETLSVNTPDITMNYMLNGWLLYQTISCRIWARSAFYQSGGAFGFRDQLQDSLSVVHIWPEIAEKQIILHAGHQFLEGDVQHWWHEPSGKGTRTKFSDDLLWLPYITCEYIKVTGDSSILDKQAPYLQDELLKEHEDEKYTIPTLSDKTGTIYEHCIKAIEKGLKFGERGIPLMGSGDWNDGMNTVGNKGNGESIWLGWFIYSVLKKFAPICRLREDMERADYFIDTADQIAKAIEEFGWDGSWYRRAYFDDGKVLGSIENSECKIDSISQSWAVISGAGNPERITQAMNSVEDYLIMKDDGLIKLLTPPFDDGDLEPGYIKGYVPGVRENGGQYTHAAAWTIIAFAMLGNGDMAYELFEMINPINHTKTHMEYSTYKVEPYVISADVYSSPPHVGRGGWSWYTGSSSWFYKAGVEHILGFKKEGAAFTINPCIPSYWPEFSMKYNYKGSMYEITVRNPEGIVKGVREIYLDGVVCENNIVPLAIDGSKHIVEVILGKRIVD